MGTDSICLFYTNRPENVDWSVPPVVAENCLRQPALGHNRFEHPRHSLASKIRVYFQGQTLPRTGIHHTEPPDRAPARYRVVGEIHDLTLIAEVCATSRPSLAYAMLPLLPPYAQPGLAINPMQPLVVHSLTGPSQQHMQAPIPEARLLPR